MMKYKIHVARSEEIFDEVTHLQVNSNNHAGDVRDGQQE